MSNFLFDALSRVVKSKFVRERLVLIANGRGVTRLSFLLLFEEVRWSIISFLIAVDVNPSTFSLVVRLS